MTHGVDGFQNLWLTGGTYRVYR